MKQYCMAESIRAALRGSKLYTLSKILPNWPKAHASNASSLQKERWKLRAVPGSHFHRAKLTITGSLTMSSHELGRQFNIRRQEPRPRPAGPGLLAIATTSLIPYARTSACFTGSAIFRPKSATTWTPANSSEPRLHYLAEWPWCSCICWTLRFSFEQCNGHQKETLRH